MKECQKSICQNKNKRNVVFEMSEGRIRRTSYHVFPGIELVYNSIHVQSVEDTVTFGGNVIEICHCRRRAYGV